MAVVVGGWDCILCRKRGLEDRLVVGALGWEGST